MSSWCKAKSTPRSETALGSPATAPQCTLRAAWSSALKSGMPEKVVAAVRYDRPHGHAHGEKSAWIFTVDGPPEMGRQMDFLWPPVSLAQIKEQLAKQAQQKLERDEFHWIIEDAAVGSIKTHHCDARTGTFSYGINIAPDHQQRGYASEAILLVVKYYFEELRYQKVTVGVFAPNAASIALHKRLGFRHEGTLRRMGFTRGAYFDLHYYGLTREEWAASPLKF